MPVQYTPKGFNCNHNVGFGSSGLVLRKPGAVRVLKIPIGTFGDDELNTIPHCRRERIVYERLQKEGRTCILEYLGKFQDIATDGIWLEFAPNHTVAHYLRDKSLPAENLRLRWALQAAKGLNFCHQNGVLHADIKVANMFLDDCLNLKIGDFSGASIDNADALAFYDSDLLLAMDGTLGLKDANVTVQTEMFAYGSALFVMTTGVAPFLDTAREEKVPLAEEHAECESRLSSIAPKDALIGTIRNCWTGYFRNMQEVLDACELEYGMLKS